MKEKYSAKQLQTETETVDSGDGSTRVIASSEGNELIEKLRQASLDNKEKNDKIIRMKTLTNDLVSVYRFNSIQLLEFKYGSREASVCTHDQTAQIFMFVLTRITFLSNREHHLDHWTIKLLSSTRTEKTSLF